ncbi:hypothetical protein ABC255_08610 [Neobacillus sp. 3P2-tot-E-2]|uniref:hypothetical protein n=1 Tax=Neobacillus sp. 3P2-tot-E-2 TaxID=3132212 RepID=UPI00399F85B9
MKTEKMMNLQLSADLFGFTEMSKQEILSMIINNVKCQMVFTKPTGEEVKVDVFGEITVDNISLQDEDGIEILSETEFNL